MSVSKSDPDYIKYLLYMNNLAVERAIVAIYQRQTHDEQHSSDTKHSNGIGFSGADARLGSYYARWILSGRRLSGHHLEKARAMSQKYVRQLAEIAEAKLAQQNAIRESVVDDVEPDSSRIEA